MKAILACLMLCACGAKVPAPATFVFPSAPDLPADARKQCPPAPAVTGALGDLATKDVALAVEYARCGARVDFLVRAYDAVRDGLIRANEQAAAKP